jgi:hypothetical protein
MWREIIVGMLIGGFLQWLVARHTWQTAKAAGYLEGRNFLVHRAKLISTCVFVDGQAIDDAKCVWIETNGFRQFELERAEQLRVFEESAT